MSTTIWPSLTDRYDAADEYLRDGLQVHPSEVNEQLRVELRNAFAAGAMWQYGRSEATAGPRTPADATRELVDALAAHIPTIDVESLPSRGVVIVRAGSSRFVEAQWNGDLAEPWSVGVYWDQDPGDDDGTTEHHATAKDAARGMVGHLVRADES